MREFNPNEYIGFSLWRGVMIFSPSTGEEKGEGEAAGIAM